MCKIGSLIWRQSCKRVGAKLEELNRRDGEDFVAWKIRCCLAKKRKETDMDWVEIRDMLGLDITPDQLRKQAVGYEEYDTYINGYNNVATTILSISDLHVPFQLDYTLLEKYRNIDILQINGDVIDCQALSRFDKQYRISPIEEMIQGRQYLIDLIEYVSPKKIVCNFGNHDKRFAAYFSKYIDTDILELLPDTSLELIFEDGFNHYNKRSKAKVWYEPLKNIFDNIEIKYIHDWKAKIGKTWFVHPLAYRSGFLATADKAKDYLQDTDSDGFDCICMAHTHSVGDTTKGYIRLLEQGAFADVGKMNYMDGKLTKPQKMGFAIICQDRDGNLIKDKTKVVVLD